MRISIIGCGWLGMPLATHLVNKGYETKGSTTRKEKLDQLAQAGIAPYQLQLNPKPDSEESFQEFLDADILIVNIPPRNHPDYTNFHLQQIQHLISLNKQSPIERVIFCSTTAVYPSSNNWVTETDAANIPSSRSGIKMLEVERLFTQEERFKTTILRFAGLYGPGRNPGGFLAGKQGLAGASNPVNLIHLDDCIGIITQIIEQDHFGAIFNACADEHPTRQNFYTKAANKIGKPLPHFDPSKTMDYKIVSNQLLKDKLNYQFIHPDPLQDVQ